MKKSSDIIEFTDSVTKGPVSIRLSHISGWREAEFDKNTTHITTASGFFSVRAKYSVVTRQLKAVLK